MNESTLQLMAFVTHSEGLARDCWGWYVDTMTPEQRQRLAALADSFAAYLRATLYAIGEGPRPLPTPTRAEAEAARLGLPADQQRAIEAEAARLLAQIAVGLYTERQPHHDINAADKPKGGQQ